jgi:putative tryptophan/tyrosine transport system substrate-binding protein
MRRREFIKLLGGAATAWPLAAHAQQPTMPVIGFINAAAQQDYKRQLAAFLKGLGETGYVEGQNVTIEYRWAEGNNDRLPALAADLVGRQVAVIAATSTPAALAAKAATASVPIVFEVGADPVQLGLVGNLNRPGGNVTGVTQTNVEMTPKRLQLLDELLPAARVMALLVNPANEATTETTTREVLAAARTLGIELHVLNANIARDVEAAFTKAVELRAGGMVVSGGPFFFSQTENLAARCLQHAMPTIYQFHRFTAAGGLMSYGSEITDAYRLAGVYAGRVLKGDRPADLPVQQATKVEFIINLRTAKALGLNVPNTLMGRADEVIE